MCVIVDYCSTFLAIFRVHRVKQVMLCPLPYILAITIIHRIQRTTPATPPREDAQPSSPDGQEVSRRTFPEYTQTTLWKSRYQGANFCQDVETFPRKGWQKFVPWYLLFHIAVHRKTIRTLWWCCQTSNQKDNMLGNSESHLEHIIFLCTWRESVWNQKALYG